MADDTKKVLIPKDKNGDGKLDNDFTAPNTDYSALPGNQRQGQDDLPFNEQPVANNIEPVSLTSARQKVFDDTNINPRTPGGTDTLDSPTQFLPDSRKAGTIDRPGQTVTLGQFLKKSAPGRRIPQGEQVGADENGNEIRRINPGDVLSDINPESLGRVANRPQGRSVAGTPGPAYGNPAVQPGTGEVVQKSISAVLTQNRFSGLQQKTYAPSDSNPDEQVIGSMQPEVGAYNPGASDEPTQAGLALKLDELKGLGLDLLKASVGTSSETPENEDVSMGKSGVLANSLRPRNLKDGVANREAFDTSKASTGQFDEPDDQRPIKSFGQLNTDDNTFEGLTSPEMAALAEAIISVTIETVANSSIFSALSGFSAIPAGPGSAPYTKGSFIPRERSGGAAGRDENVYATDLGFVYAPNGFETAVRVGEVILFGRDITNLEATAVGTKLGFSRLKQEAQANIKNSPGFYVNMCRAVMRDIQLFDATFPDASQIVAQSLPGSFAAIAVVDAYRSSKIVAFINTLASVGQSALRAASSPFNVDALPPSGFPTTDPNSPGASYNPMSHAMKSRDGRKVAGGVDSLKLAWRGSSTPSMYLLPAEIEYGSVLNAVSTLANESPTSAHMSMEGKTRSAPNGRLPQEFVEKHERLLESEYVPFYFHDLRTNEIISFHAFLSNLTDDYSANYGGQSAIGRADPIKIYKDTTRNIGFSFYIAATSREDFNEMWFKINKLVTLLYPQYSQGRQKNQPKQFLGVNIPFTFDENFIMPFSQVMSASPMIRLRIGDVIKTNFSKFNLSRLFGLGTEQFVPITGVNTIVPTATLAVYRYLFQGLGALADTQVPPGVPFAGIANAALQAGMSAALSSNALGDRASGRVLAATERMRQEAQEMPVVENAKLGYQVNDIVRLSFPSVRVLHKAAGRGPSQKFLGYRDVYATVVERPTNLLGEQRAARYKVRLSSSFSNALMKNFDVSNTRNGSATYFMNHHDASIVPGGLAKERLTINGIRAATGVTNITYIPFVAAFLSNTFNAVVRSFDQASGKGLPGFVTSLSFNWIDDESPWELDKGSRAPRICKVTARFAPTHDIAPGLDHLGYNRAPLYQVGDVVNSIAGKSGDWLDSDIFADALQNFDLSAVAEQAKNELSTVWNSADYDVF